MRPRILIIGATGKVGGAVFQNLLTEHLAGTIELVAAVREPAKGNPFLKAGAACRILDLDKVERFGLSAIQEAFHNIDRVLLVTGYNFDMVEQSKAAIDAAKKAGVQQIVHIGACGDDETTIAHWSWHQLIERYIEWHGYDFTHLRPEWYMDNFLSWPPAKGQITSYIGETRVSWVSCEDVGAVAAAALRMPAQHHGKVYRLGADVRSHQEIAEILSAVTEKPFGVDNKTPEEFLTMMISQGGNEAYFRCIQNQFIRNREGSIDGADRTYGDLTGLIGRRAMNWPDFAAKHKEFFRTAAI